MKVKNICMVLAVSMMIAMTGCSKKEKAVEEVSSAVNVEVYTVGQDNISDKVTYTGEIKAGENVSVSAKVSAKAVSINVNEGDYIKAGQTLAVLDKTDIQLSYEQAEASYNSAKANYDMMVNSTAPRSLSQAQQSAKSAKIEYDNAITSYNREKELYEQNSAVKLAEQNHNDAVAAYERAKKLYDNDTNVISARNGYQTAKDNYTRSEELYSKGAISRVELDTARTSMENAKASLDTVEANNKAALDNANSAVISTKENLENAKITAGAALDVAKANVERTKNSLDSANENVSLTQIANQESIETAEASVKSAEAALNIAKNNLNNTTITSPISGYVSARNVNAGQMVSPGVEIFAVKNSNTVDGEIKVTESVIPNVQVGTKAVVTIKSAGISDISGTVTLVNPVKDERTGMYTVRVTMDNAENKLKVGMFADITLITASVDEAVVIPSEAVMQSGDELYVYVANGDKAEKRVVTTGIEEGDYVQINSGINIGDKVIVSGKDYISETNNSIKIVSETRKESQQ